MLNRCDFRCVLKVENVRDRRRSTGRLFRRVAGTRTAAVDAERSRRREYVRPTAAGSTRTDTVVLLRLDSGALERKHAISHTTRMYPQYIYDYC